MSIRKLYVILIIAISIILSSMSVQASDLTIAASSMPNAQILDSVKSELAKYGINLIVKIIKPMNSPEYQDPNMLLATGEIDANFFQSSRSIESFANEHGVDIVSAGSVYLRPMCIYSTKHKSISSAPNGGQVIIPMNQEGRALSILNESGLIKLKDGTGYNGDYDSVEPGKYKVIWRPDNTMTEHIHLFDFAVLSQEYALKAKLNPSKDSVFSESITSPYAESIGIRKSDSDKFEIKTLMKVLRSEKTKKFIKSRYDGRIIPSF